jgi:MoxR-like ATPase
MLVARGYAVIDGRDFVVPEDVKAVAVPALAHRITIRPELWMTDISGRTVVETVLGQVPAPTARDRV